MINGIFIHNTALISNWIAIITIIIMVVFLFKIKCYDKKANKESPNGALTFLGCFLTITGLALLGVNVVIGATFSFLGLVILKVRMKNRNSR